LLADQDLADCRARGLIVMRLVFVWACAGALAMAVVYAARKIAKTVGLSIVEP
jgi:hypothetical protein